MTLNLWVECGRGAWSGPNGTCQLVGAQHSNICNDPAWFSDLFAHISTHAWLPAHLHREQCSCCSSPPPHPSLQCTIGFSREISRSCVLFSLLMHLLCTIQSTHVSCIQMHTLLPPSLQSKISRDLSSHLCSSLGVLCGACRHFSPRGGEGETFLQFGGWNP